jgi:RNA polymerase subunit RPABC4/transcription elongation factor Spt4
MDRNNTNSETFDRHLTEDILHEVLPQLYTWGIEEQEILREVVAGVGLDAFAIAERLPLVRNYSNTNDEFPDERPVDETLSEILAHLDSPELEEEEILREALAIAQLHVDTRLPTRSHAPESLDLPKKSDFLASGMRTVEPPGDTDTCPICIDEWVSEDTSEIVAQDCHRAAHTFHKDCLMTWLEDVNTCPMCRRQLFEKIRRSTDGTIRLGGLELTIPLST